MTGKRHFLMNSRSSSQGGRKLIGRSFLLAFALIHLCAFALSRPTPTPARVSRTVGARKPVLPTAPSRHQQPSTVSASLTD